jgi:hypothetical protein
MTLFEADPKLLERQFVAEVKLIVPSYYELPREQYNVADIYPVYEAVLDSTRDISRLLDRIVQYQKLSGEQMMMLVAERRFVRNVTAPRDPGTSQRQERTASYDILAPTPERAKELSLALLATLDAVLTQPIQRELQQRKEGYEKQIAQNREMLSVAVKERDTLKEQLKTAESLDAQAIGDLRTQRRLLEVDLAGVRARVEACEALLNRGGLTNSRKEQVENLKVAAEIELAGLAARQKTLDFIINQGDKGLALASKDKSVKSQESNIRRFEGYVADTQRRMDMYGPFRLVDDKVVIRPIKWEKQPAEK